MYRQFNTQQLYVLPTQCIYVLCGELTAIISLYSINWLIFIIETECVYCTVRAGSLDRKQRLCPYTALTEKQCVYCAARTESLNTVHVILVF